jgi:hypothetical protein
MAYCAGRPVDPPRAFERPLSLTPRKPKFVTEFSVHCPKPVHGPDDSRVAGFEDSPLGRPNEDLSAYFSSLIASQAHT